MSLYYPEFWDAKEWAFHKATERELLTVLDEREGRGVLSEEYTLDQLRVEAVRQLAPEYMDIASPEYRLHRFVSRK